MRFYVDCNELISAVLSVIKALPLRTTLPALEGIYVVAEREGVRLLCSDLMMQKECFIPATVEEEGSCVVPGKLFSELIRKMPDSILELNMQSTVLVISGGRTRNQLQCIEFDEFPIMSFSGDHISVKMDRLDFKNMINQTSFAIATDDSKPMLTGAFTEFDGNRITMVATDSYQLALKHIEVNEELPQKSTIIPGKTVNELGRMMDETQDDVNLLLSKTHIRLDLGHTALVARLLDGNYIDYKRLLPKESKTKVSINREELINSIERAQLVAKEGNNNILMSFEGDKLTITAESFIGSINDEIEVKLIGEDIKIAFNPKFCLNILKCIPDETVYFEFNSSISPCVIRPVRGESYYYLIVPMRIY
ncbi:MAG: DNA polymerase III subunit beta [Clostridia bacterium]|nr:DNA polymerase III subunit beta [Clostridia bacterium]